MKDKFYKIAKKLGAEILSYKTYRSFGMGGLQVYEIELSVGSKKLFFTDSYFHLSGDAPKVLEQFSNEINNQTPTK